MRPDPWHLAQRPTPAHDVQGRRPFPVHTEQTLSIRFGTFPVPLQVRHLSREVDLAPFSPGVAPLPPQRLQSADVVPLIVPKPEQGAHFLFLKPPQFRHFPVPEHPEQMQDRQADCLTGRLSQLLHLPLPLHVSHFDTPLHVGHLPFLQVSQRLINVSKIR